MPGGMAPAEDAETPPLLAYIAEALAEPDEPEQDAEHEPVSVAAADLPDEAARLRAGLAEIDSAQATMWHNALETLRKAVTEAQQPLWRRWLG
jgi:hypothetical protein